MATLLVDAWKQIFFDEKHHKKHLIFPKNGIMLDIGKEDIMEQKRNTLPYLGFLMFLDTKVRLSLVTLPLGLNIFTSCVQLLFIPVITLFICSYAFRYLIRGYYFIY